MARKLHRLMIGVFSGSAALIVGAVLLSRQLSPPRLPPPPPPEEPAPAPGGLRCSPLTYQALVKSDAERYKAAEPTVESLGRVLRGGEELAAPRTLKVKGKGRILETAHLRLQLSTAKLSSTVDGAQGFRADHLVLSITNRGAVPVAYRVETSLPNLGKCGSKADLPHNAIALLPKETARRTECLFHGQGLFVKRVEVYEVSELGARYLSRLEPSEGGPFEMRLARAHDRGELPPCRSMPWRDLEAQGDVWRPIIDFYARHNCDEYTLPRDYIPWQVPGKLPVCTP